MGTNPMGMISRIIGPVFNIFALDIASRQIQDLTTSGTLQGKIPRAGLAAISLSFNLARLKLSTYFTKGLPFGISTFANLAVKLSALQIGLQSLPVFFDPTAYSVSGAPSAPGGVPAVSYQPPQVGYIPYSQSALTGFGIGDYVCVISGSDADRCGNIESMIGSNYVLSGISNQFDAGNLRRG